MYILVYQVLWDLVVYRHFVKKLPIVFIKFRELWLHSCILCFDGVQDFHVVALDHLKDNYGGHNVYCNDNVVILLLVLCFSRTKNNDM